MNNSDAVFAAAAFSKSVALRYLHDGIRKGLVSVQTRGDSPQNIWAVTDAGEPLEAQLENLELGVIEEMAAASQNIVLDHIKTLLARQGESCCRWRASKGLLRTPDKPIRCEWIAPRCPRR